MSFKSLVNKLMKEGKSKEAATKIAGKVASEKMKGAGSGPTAKQKARMKKSPAKKYDRVVLGGNKGDKSKTKPGKKDYESPAKMKKSPTKKALKGDQGTLPGHLQKAILDAPAKMLSKSGMKMMKDGSPAKKMEKTKTKDNKRKTVEKTKSVYRAPRGKHGVGGTTIVDKKKVTTDKKTGDVTTKKKRVRKGVDFDSGTRGRSVKKSKLTSNPMDIQMNEMINSMRPKPTKERQLKRENDDRPTKIDPDVRKNQKNTVDGYSFLDDERNFFKKAGSPAKKSKKKVEQDYARNAIADYKAGKKKEGNYEKKKALELAAGESGVMMKKSPGMMKTNEDGGGYAAKNMAAPAKQLKKLGSVLSKHMKSN